MPAQSIVIDWAVICEGCARAPEDPEDGCPYEALAMLKDDPGLISCSNWISPEDHKALMQEPGEVQSA